MTRVFLVLLFLGGAYTSRAQKPATDSAVVKSARHQAQELRLNPARQKQWEAAVAYRAYRLRQLPPFTDSVARTAALVAIHRDYERSVKALLTPGQYKTYLKKAEQRQSILKKEAQKGGGRIRQLPAGS